MTRSGEGTPGTKGAVMRATFQLERQEFTAYNKVFISIHPYMSHRVYHNSRNYTTAENLAYKYYFAMVNGTQRTGFPVLNTVSN